MTATVAPTNTIARRASLGAVGGALWALSPVAWALADLRTQTFGTVSFVAVLASYWLVAVLGTALIVVGHTASAGSCTLRTIFAKLQVADRAEAMIRARAARLGS